MAESPKHGDTWIFELRGDVETEGEFAARVAMFCVALTARSLGMNDRTNGVELDTLLQLN